MTARGVVAVDETLLVGARLAFEWGAADRARGVVRVYDAALGVLAGWRSPTFGPFSVDVTAAVSLAALVYDGDADRPDVVGGTTVALVGELGLEVAPSLRFGPVAVSLPLGFAGVLFAPEGEVTGEPPVVAGGPVLSASLRVSFVPFEVR